MEQFSNKLAGESSPYLQQHAHNPVNWFPYSEEALSIAKKEDKPILVSIGYSSCHWCHVMEKESFEKEDVAAIMNEHFICIKIDREERPDLDHFFMDALQAIAGSGGWPLNVFLTPEGKPFYGGTYFPPKKMYNRSSWTETLLAIADAFKNKRNEIEEQAETLVGHLKKSNSFGSTIIKPGGGEHFPEDSEEKIFQEILKSADKVWGGFGQAPKFPQTFTINYLLQYYYYNDNDDALNQATLTLDRMMQGGLYDHIGGGFSRYSTDSEWQVPHFEKMLYDNGLLLACYSDAYKLTGKRVYLQVINETVDFLEREMTSKEGGFYTALDADSEGVEGKFYIWSKSEIDEILGNDAEWFCDLFSISEQGNWEGGNIIWTKIPFEKWITEKQWKVDVFWEKIISAKKLLLSQRASRVRPLLDDKIILSWNALMNIGLQKAFQATGDQRFFSLAKRNMDFLIENFLDKDDPGKLRRLYEKSTDRFPAMLEDYSYFIKSLIGFQETSGDNKYLEIAKKLVERTILDFSDEQNILFYFSASGLSEGLVRKKEIYDGAMPSGNSVMAENLLRLGVLLGDNQIKERAFQMVKTLEKVVLTYPLSFGVWSSLMAGWIRGFNEIAVIGNDWKQYLEDLLSHYVPLSIIQASKDSDENFPLLAGKEIGPKTLYYLCKNQTCQEPSKNIDLLLNQVVKNLP